MDIDNIYYNKYLKYKKKYLLLKNLRGGIDFSVFSGFSGFSGNNKPFVEFIGSGTFGCLICPPLRLSDEKQNNSETSFAIKNFSFKKINNCNYVGKIVALNTHNTNGDSYQDELKQLLKIRELDPNGDYTPKLIYANIHKGKEILKSIVSLNTNELNLTDILNCIIKKINPNEGNDYGYIILENTGTTLHKKFNNSDNSFSETELIQFLTKFCKLLEFIKILYDNDYLHLDIKLDNITIKDNVLRLIDFGRTTQININNYDSIITRFLGSYNFVMFPFEPKIYINLFLYFRNLKIEKMSFKNLKELINTGDNFKKFIKPYDITKLGLDIIFANLFREDFIKYIESLALTSTDDLTKIDMTEQYYTFIYDYFKSEFIEYIESFETNFTDELDVKDLLYKIFFPIIKKFDMYCMGIVLSRIVIVYNKNYEKYNEEFKNRFEKLIKLLLLNKLNNVDEFINKLNITITDLQWLQSNDKLNPLQKKED